MKKLLLITGPQGSGNHMFSKLLALHPRVWGWKALNKTYWIGHDQEPFNAFWHDPSLWQTTDFGDYQYAFASISVPYVQNGQTIIPDIDTFISGAESAGWQVQIAIIGRDINILEKQQKRLRRRITVPYMLEALDHHLSHRNVQYISHELVYLYKQRYLKSLSQQLNFPIDYDNPQVDEILKENSNAKYVQYVEDTKLDNLVIDCLASTAAADSEWDQRKKETPKKNIVIFYSPGSYGSFLSWLIDRFNSQRKLHEPAVVDDPLQPNGSSHGHASFCQHSSLDTIADWLGESNDSPWGYRIWAGWPVNAKISLDQAISETLKLLRPQDRLVIISRTSEWEARLSWLNARSKLDQSRFFDMLGIKNEQELDAKYQEQLQQRHFQKVNDPRFIEISVNDLLHSPSNRLLSFVDQLGLNSCDQQHLEQILPKHRAMQHNVKLVG